MHKANLFPDTTLESTSTIYFYNRGDPFYEFTNFYPKRIKLDGLTWPTTEHYFQAQKFVGTPYFDYVSRLPRPRDAFELCRDPTASKWVRGDWHQVKDDVMLKALMTKFSQHEDLKKQLLDTGKRKLVEHTWNDSYWGDGGDGKGRNRLGELLMQVRASLGTAKTGDAKKHSTAFGKLLSRHSSKRTKDDNYGVEENCTGRHHQGHTHLASPLASRRVRSQSVDLGRPPLTIPLSTSVVTDYGVEENGTGRQHQAHAHLASPIVSRQVRSQSVDLGRPPLPMPLSTPVITGFTASSLASHRNFGLRDCHQVSISSLANSCRIGSLTTLSDKFSCSRPSEAVRLGSLANDRSSASPVLQSPSLPRHPNESSVNFNIINHLPCR